MKEPGVTGFKNKLFLIQNLFVKSLRIGNVIKKILNLGSCH